MQLVPPPSAVTAPAIAADSQADAVHWQEDGVAHTACWRSEAGVVAPRRLQVVDDTLNADGACRLACEGTALLWRGDFHNARQLLQALGRRLDKRRPPAATPAQAAFPEAFHRHRMAQAQRARVLGQVLIPLEPGHAITLRRAPDVREACREAWGPSDGPALVSLRELLGLVGAHEWRKKGVPVAALGGAHIHPHYGVFSPVRGEYVPLVAQAPLPAACSQLSEAWDIGTGTGVLAAVLAQRNLKRVLAIDQDPRALACAADNLKRLGLQRQVELQAGDLFPAGQAPLIVCNPPWVPAKPSAPIEHAVYDPDSRMLRGFLTGLREHLLPGGEGWLILSDLAEHLQLRSRAQLQGWIEAAGLRVLGRLDAKPAHPKAQVADNPLHTARAAEITSLWRLGVA